MISQEPARQNTLPPERFSTILDNLREVVFQTDGEGRWTFLNRAWEEITGFSLIESLGRLFLDFVHPADREENLEKFRPLMERRKEYCRHEVRYLTRGGGFRWIEVHARLTLDEHNVIVGTSGTLIDITDRRTDTENLRASRQRLQFVLASSPVVIFGACLANGGSWQTSYLSDSVRAVLGFDPETFTSVPEFWLSIVHPDDLEEVHDSFAELAKHGKSTFRFRGRHANGSYVWLRCDCQTVREVAGQPVEMFGSLIDETHTHKIEESLRTHTAILEIVGSAAQRLLDASSWRQEVSALLASLGETAHADRLYIFENVAQKDGDFLASLKYEWTAPGVTPQLGNPLLQRLSYRQSGFARWVELLSRGQLVQGNTRCFPACEQPMLRAQQAVSFLVTPIFAGQAWWGLIGFVDCATERDWSGGTADALKAAGGILGAAIRREQTEAALLRSRCELEQRVHERTAELEILNDRLRGEVAERRQVERALADREARFRTLLENASDLIFLSNAATKLQYVSPTVTRVLGYNPTDLIGRTGFEFIDPQDLPLVEARFREGLTVEGSHSAFEFRVRHKDGSYRTVEAIGNNQLANPAVGGVVVTLRDITDRRRLEDQFRQAQKMEAIGRLAGGVAHDFNNLLTVICGYGDLLSRLLPEGDSLQRNATQIKRAGDRATALVRQLLAFSRVQEVHPSTVELNDAVQDLQKMLRRLIGEDIELTIDPAPEPVYVRMDRAPFDQIIMNLSVNAKDAMPDGGALAIVVRPHPLIEHVGCLTCRSACEALAVVVVRDTGIGMSEETKAHIFEPFFTTKPVGKGTGLGLSMVYGAVRQAGGHVCVETRPGQGTTFQICLPRVENPALIREGITPPLPPGGHETILLAEDEELVRTIMVDTLRDAGYHVLAARDGAQALDLLQAHNGEIHLVLTDVIMPRLSGPDLVRRLSATRSATKVLYTSGYPKDKLPPGACLLKKPFTPEELLREVRSTLDVGVPGV